MLDPCVVDEDARCAELLRRRLDHCRHGGRVGDVRRHGDRAWQARRVCLCLVFVRTEVVDAHRGARVRERLRDRGADAAAGAGDDCDLSRDVHVSPFGCDE